MAAKKKAATKAKPCKCVEQVNKQLAPLNAKVTQSLLLNLAAKRGEMSAPLIELHKIDSLQRKPLPTLFAAYCPFCGKKIPD